MSANTVVTIEGLDKALAKLHDAGVIARPSTRMLTRMATAVVARAKTRAPVDTGRLRSSITFVLDTKNAVPHWAKVGTNVFYAPYMEFGTGRLSDFPGPHKEQHNPPAGALNVWARRHGFKGGWQVARIISMRGGLAPRMYLRKAVEEAMAEFRKAGKDCLSDIGTELGGK